MATVKLQKKKIMTDIAHFPRPGQNYPYMCAPVQLCSTVKLWDCSTVQLRTCGTVQLCATVQCTVCTLIESTRLDSELPGVCGVDNFFGSSFGFGKMTSALGFISRLECYNSCTLSALGPRVISYMCRKQFEGLF